MFNTAVTFFQIFGIGFSFGLAGPCFLTCAPILFTYIGGRKLTWRQSLIDILVFLTGRLSAYLILGYLAGLSGAILRQFSSSTFIPSFKLIGGVVIILLGIYVWTGKEPISWLCKGKTGKVFSFGSLFLSGFAIGIYPCAPLLALLFEIALIAKTALTGVFYALFFGLGTLISGFLVMGALSGIFTYLPAKLFKSKTSNLVFRTICALLLILLGLGLIFQFYPYSAYKRGIVN